MITMKYRTANGKKVYNLSPIVLSPPRSGLHLLLSVVQYIHIGVVPQGIQPSSDINNSWNNLYLHHTHFIDKPCPFCKMPLSKHDNKILLLRNPYENMGKTYYLGGTHNYGSIGKQSIALNYSSLINIYDTCKNDKYFIRYEDMINDTENTFKNLCNFLKIDFKYDGRNLLEIGQNYYDGRNNVSFTPKNTINHYSTLLNTEQRNEIKKLLLADLDKKLYNKYLSIYDD